MKKRLLSALLALVMVLALLPVSVFADAAGGTATKAKLELSLDFKDAEGAAFTFAAGDEVTVKCGNETITLTLGEDSTTWTVTAPQGYTGTYTSGKLTLEAEDDGPTGSSFTNKADDYKVLVTKLAPGADTAPPRVAPATAAVTGSPTFTDGKDGAPAATPAPSPASTPNWGGTVKPNATWGGTVKTTGAAYKTTDTAASSTVGAITGTPGWYISEKKDNFTTWYRIDKGFVVNGTWYPDGETLPNLNATTGVGANNVVVLGKNPSFNVGNNTTLTVDVYGNVRDAVGTSIDSSGVTLTISGASKITSLTITDSKYRSEKRYNTTNGKAKVTLSSVLSEAKGASLKMTDVDCTGIEIEGPYTRTVTLENVDVTGNIKLSGKGEITTGSGASAKKTPKYEKQTLKMSNTLIGGNTVTGVIEVCGNSSSVELKDVTVGSGTPPTGTITMKGTAPTLTVSGGQAGDVTIEKGDLASSTSVGVGTINVTSGEVGKIDFANSDLTGALNITVAGTTKDIDLSKTAAKTPSVKVTGGTTGKITTKAGTVAVSGTNAVVGGLALSGSTKFSLTGTNHTINDIEVTGKNVGFSVDNEPSNRLRIGAGGKGLDSYTGGEIKGGTWLAYPVPAKALHSSLVYELVVKGSPNTITYYNYDQLNQALVTQVQKDGVLCAVGQSNNLGNVTADHYELVFMNGKTIWGTMQITGQMQIKLPTLVNTVTITRWADKNHSYNAGSMYSTPAVDGNGVAKNTTWQLNASGGITSGDITKITDISVKGNWANNTATGGTTGDVKATLNGTVITLSGAVPNDRTVSMTLYLTTDAIESKENDETEVEEDVPVTLPVDVTFYNDGSGKSLMFSNVANDKLTHGATLENADTNNGVLRLSNGTKYTLNGSGLKVRPENIYVVDVTNGGANDYDSFGHNFIEVNVNVKEANTPQTKQAIIDALNSGNALYDWSRSPAVREAVNAALASLTESQVQGFIKTAKTNAWRHAMGGTPTDSQLEDTGYNDAFLVPYLQVNVTAYNKNGTLTATLVPSWRVEVRQTGTGTNPRFGQAFASDKDLSLPGNVYIAKSGAALSLGSNVSEILQDSFDALNSGVKVRFGDGLFGGSTNVFMHQDATYAYRQQNNSGTNSSFLIKHNGGTSLGTVTINTTEPLVKVYKSNKAEDINAGAIGYYNTLQAAVNDTLDSQHIDIDQNYKGSLSVTVTGYARTFTIQSNGQNVVLASASGGLASLNNTGSEYTVQLSRNASVATNSTTASIAVAAASTGASTGSAVVSATSAVSGSTVTVTCTPAAGYRTSSVAVSAHMTKDNKNSAVTVTKVSDNVYSFKVPEGCDTITVTPAFVVGTTATGLPFTDVSADHWAFNSVKYVYDNGLMNGVNTAGTQFGGAQTLNRAMVVTILYRAAGSPYVGTSNSFSDVPSNQWYTQAVAWASQNGIVTGYTNGTFQPNWAITRQELATILYRYNNSYKGRATTGSTTLASFSDQGRVSDWAIAGMQWAVGNGIVNGITNGVSTTLSPAGSATRYEAATMLMRYGQGLGL